MIKKSITCLVIAIALQQSCKSSDKNSSEFLEVPTAPMNDPATEIKTVSKAVSKIFGFDPAKGHLMQLKGENSCEVFVQYYAIHGTSRIGISAQDAVSPYSLCPDGSLDSCMAFDSQIPSFKVERFEFEPDKSLGATATMKVGGLLVKITKKGEVAVTKNPNGSFDVSINIIHFLQKDTKAVCKGAKIVRHWGK